jgi:hypothetical protein
MKKLIFIGLTALFSSCVQKETRVLVFGEGEVLLELRTPTAACGKCQKVMEDGLKEVKGVSASILNLNTKKVSIAYSPKTTDSISLKKTVLQLTKQFPCK